ncbi:hypothetical protein AVEN_112992-1 [Araneus ventricosus]|uniref:Transposase Tc1-like domain-containing protein n=2 Tax=Araneus ventricosus TaxID=182803 RepID=A0A4Y2NCQ5_ARAVE|nr:hypothetical protein AVEN_215039-1 [Araneus ventricosus]GBN36425.1 hypothetical protein AVEN_112992-1 [Araneus ventricosus]
MQILYVKYVSVHVCVGGASRETGFISSRKVRRISFASTPRRISWCYFAAIDKIQIVTVKMSNHQRLDDEMKWRIVGRLEAGQSQVQICREFNLTPSVVCNLWKQLQDTGSIERKPGQGRPRATTATEDRYLSIIARRNRGATASQLFRDLYAATGTHVSRVTVSKRLHETGLFARRPAVCVPLTSTNRRIRLTWCRKHRDWSMDQWAIVLLTDESRFSLNTILAVRSYGENQGPATYPPMSAKSTIMTEGV